MSKIKDLIKSGNFTIAYHDCGYCCLYKGKLKYDDLPEDGKVKEYEGEYDGYIPDVVKELVSVLGGKVITI